MVGGDGGFGRVLANTVHMWKEEKRGDGKSYVPATVGPQALTASTAAAVEQCSS